MRIRTIKPEFFTHEGLFEAERETGLPIRLAFAGLWCAADKEGRFKWEPRRLGVSILPYDDVDFSHVLDACLTRGFLVKYRVGDAWFGAVPSWKKHQFVNARETASQLPAIDGADEVCDASSTRAARVDDASHKERKGKEGKGKEGYRAPAGADAPDVGLFRDDPVSWTPAQKPERARDPLFDALAAVDGSAPRELTQRAARACGVALAEIRKATPTVTPEEVSRRAANYRAHMPDVTITPSALASHWAKCANAPAGKGGTWDPGYEADGQTPKY